MDNRSLKTKSIVEAGLISALIVVLALINVYVPGFSIFGTFLLPIPVTVLYLRHNFKVSLSAVLVSGILVGLTYDPIRGLTSAVVFGLTGLTLGYCIKKDMKAGITIILLSAASALGTIIDYSVYLNFIDKRGLMAFITAGLKMLNESMDSAIKIYKNFGITAEQIKPLQDTMKLFTPEFVMHLIPSFLIIGGLISAFLSYKITSMILKKFRFNMKEMRPFTEIYLNSRIGVVLVTLLLLGIVLSKYKISGYEYIVTTSQVLLQIALILDGVSLLTFFLRRKFNISKAVVVFIIIFTVLQQPFSVIYMYAGLADIIMDFRKLDPLRRGKLE
ncbi:YybS family protein [Clostridium sp.]|uniref:YybS family protein n=1 Tax=Clostridium sp. TaxID=1506 RepID=UPI002FDEBB00